MRPRKRNENPTQAIIYARFSPRPQEQVDITESCAYQIKACEAYCLSKGYAVLARHEDREASGATMDRPGLNDAIEDAVGCGGILVAYSLSRIGRSQKGVLRFLEEIDRRGADIAVLDYEINTATAIGRAMLGFVVVLNNLEREQVSERTSKAMRTYQGAGRSISSHPPYGWMFNGTMTLASGITRRKLSPNTLEQPTLGRIIQLSDGGRGVYQIATILNAEKVPSRNGPWSHKKIRCIVNRHLDGLLKPTLESAATGR